MAGKSEIGQGIGDNDEMRSGDGIGAEEAILLYPRVGDSDYGFEPQGVRSMRLMQAMGIPQIRVMGGQDRRRPDRF